MYFAPLNKEMMERKVVIHNPIRPGIKSEGINNEQVEAIHNIKLGM